MFRRNNGGSSGGNNGSSSAPPGNAGSGGPSGGGNEGPSDTAIFLKSLQDPDVIERVRISIKNAHVFKLPPRQSVSVGWRGADWKEKVWQGIIKVVERGDLTAVLLVDRQKGSIFAVCPVKEGAVDRCIDSSRYFVLRIENATGRHMFIGVAFNERNDAFDFNTALEDSRREKEAERIAASMPANPGPSVDYSIKEGQKIRVALPKGAPTAVRDGNGVDGFGDDYDDDEDDDDEEDDDNDDDGQRRYGGFGAPMSTNDGAKAFEEGHSLRDSNGGSGGAAARRKSSHMAKRRSTAGPGGFLQPSSKDTPSRGPQTDGGFGAAGSNAAPSGNDSSGDAAFAASFEASFTPFGTDNNPFRS